MRPTLPLVDIVAAVSAELKIGIWDMQAKRRDRRASRARAVVVALARRAGHSWSEIGEAIARAAQTTRWLADRAETYSDLEACLERCRARAEALRARRVHASEVAA